MDRIHSLRQQRVGASVNSDHRRGKITRLVIDDLANLPEGRTPPKSSSVERKDAAQTGNLLIIDGNQVWCAPQAIEYLMVLVEVKSWFIECVPPLYLPLPFAPFCCFHSHSSRKLHPLNSTLGHASIRRELKPVGISFVNGEHAHNRIVFKRSSRLTQPLSFRSIRVVSPVSAKYSCAPYDCQVWRACMSARR